MITQVGYSVVGRSGGQVTPYVVCTVHMETGSADFLIEPKNNVYNLSVVSPQNHWDGL
jgi:hypothetical protein